MTSLIAPIFAPGGLVDCRGGWAFRAGCALLATLVLVASGSGAQSASGDDPPQSATGTWFAWLETPAQHLRLLVEITSESRDDESASIRLEGTITSPDQTPQAIALTDAQLDASGKFSFRVIPTEDSPSRYAFQGQRDGDWIRGTFEQSGASMPLELQRLEAVPEEGQERLGANSAWTGAIDLVVRKLPMRFRVYDSPPYASKEQPRLLFDSLAEKVNGFPISLSRGKEDQIVFSIAGIPGNAKYTAKLSESLDRFQGRFSQGALPLALELARVQELKEQPIEQDALVRLVQGLAIDAAPAPDASPSAALTQEPATEAEGKPESHATPQGIREEPFVIERVDYSRPKEKKDGRWVHPMFRIAGTITWPKDTSDVSKLPAMVFITGSGPQDRDETIGSHKPFRVLAHHLAEQGMASLRYDDRGVGESTGDFLNATTADFADDALAVWEFAKSLEGVDPRRIGLLGHSEGGLIAPMVAGVQREVAFLVLLAPPVLPGNQILMAQIERMSELQGVSAEDRMAALDLQQELQRLALELPTDSDTADLEVRKAVSSRWESLRSLSRGNNAASDEDLKQTVIERITQQFQGLRTPWMKYFLAYDPSTNWLLFQCPTLAMWGERDVQVLPEANRDCLESILERNPRLDAELVILPELNHLFQRAKTGLPDEYESIRQTLDPTLLDGITQWLKRNELLP